MEYQDNDDGGWNDTAQENKNRLLRGTLLRFSDGRWRKGKEQQLVPDGTELVAECVKAAWIRWQDGKVAEQIIRAAGQRMVDRDELSNTDEAEWPLGPSGEPQDPWRNTRFVWLVNPVSAEGFTFSTSSWGGRGAVGDLADATARMRGARFGAMPVVQLGAAEMPTKYGLKSKPAFKIVGWVGGDAPLAPPAKRIAAPEPPIQKPDWEDEIPFNPGDASESGHRLSRPHYRERVSRQ
jgi:hypothetical protein